MPAVTVKPTNPMDPKIKKNKKKKMKKRKSAAKNNMTDKQMADMSIDDMFEMINNDNNDSDGEDTQDTKSNNKKQKKRKRNKQSTSQKKKAKQNNDQDEDDFEVDSDEDVLTQASKLSRSDYLQTLKKNDPQFYATMMKAEDIMDLRSSEEEEEEEEEDLERGGAIFVPPEKFEVDSEESDAEDDTLESRGNNIITAAMVNKWEEQLMGKFPHSAFSEANQALLAAIESLGGQEKDSATKSKYKVEGPQIFNAIVRMCLKRIPGALLSILSIKNADTNPADTKKWQRYKSSINSYLRHLIMLTDCVAEPSAAEAILSRGVRVLAPYYAALPSTCRALVKRLATLWATSEKRVRVCAFMCVFKVARAVKGEFLEWILKRLYLSFVQNSRFTSPSSWGMIDFMRVSLVEVYALDPNIAYKHAFVYIRQLAFHLRNALTLKKKERIQLVYNWQYIHCVHLWSDLLARTHPCTALHPIIYPLTQIAVGVIKLQPTTAYYPLRFHVCNILTELSRHTHTFIPVLPFLLEILNQAPLHKKHQKASIRPFDWLCMLRLSEAEMKQSAFKDGVVDQLYNSILNYTAVESASIAFPELVVPLCMQLKNFIKNSPNANYSKKMKSLLDKVKENSAFIEGRRKEVAFSIADNDAVRNWETATKQHGTPLNKHYDAWKKTWEKDHQRRLVNHIDIDDYNLPSIRRKELTGKMKEKGKEEIKEMFPSDDSDDDDEMRFLMKEERSKERKKKEREEKEEKDNDDDDNNDDDNDDNDDDNNDDDNNDDDDNDDDDDDLNDDNDDDMNDDDFKDDVVEMNLSDME